MLKENNQNKPQKDKTIEHLDQEDLISESEDTEESSTDEITGSSSEGQMSPVEERLIRCEILIQQGEFAKAKRLLEWAFNREPTNWQAYKLAFLCDFGIKSLEDGVELPYEDCENLSERINKNINYKSALRFCKSQDEKQKFIKEVQSYFVKPASEALSNLYSFIHDNKEFYKYDGDEFVEFENKLLDFIREGSSVSIISSFKSFNAKITAYNEDDARLDPEELVLKMMKEESEWMTKISTNAWTWLKYIQGECFGDFLSSHSHDINLDNVVYVDKYTADTLLLFRKQSADPSSVAIEDYRIDRPASLDDFLKFYNQLLLAFGNDQFGYSNRGQEEVPRPAAYSQQITNLKENYIKLHSQTFDLAKENQKLKVGQAKSKEQFKKEAIAAYVGIALFIIAIFIICIVFLH